MHRYFLNRFAACALSMTFGAALAAPSVLNTPARVANLDGEWSLLIGCTPYGQRKAWRFSQTVAVKNNKGGYDAEGDSFFAKGSIAFRGGHVVLEHVATKKDDPDTFFAIKQPLKPVDANTFQVNGIAHGAGHDAGEARCIGLVQRVN